MSAATPGLTSGNEWLLSMGAGPADLARHYDIGTEFHALWLAENLGYSCALWSGAADETLEHAENAKIDFFARQLEVGPDTTGLDIGCGWGGFATRLIRRYEVEEVVGLTLSQSHAKHCLGLGLQALDLRLESWVQHEPQHTYDFIVCMEALEHFANEKQSPEARAAIYSQYFRRCHQWLGPDGRMGIQVSCFDGIGHDRALVEAPLTKFVANEIFPASAPPHLSELISAWEPFFAVRVIRSDRDQYARTLAVWLDRLKANRTAIEHLVGPERFHESWKYLAAMHALFRLHAWTLHRIVLDKRRDR
jgi:cyclopropane-fatty-acyl-phospholipid synthase